MISSYESGDFPNTTFSGGPICSPLYLLQLGPGCTLVTPLTSANYPNNTILVDYTTWARYCKYFTDVLELLPPVSPHWPETSLVIFTSSWVLGVGTYSEPLGNLSMIQDYTANGRYGLVVAGNTIGYYLNTTRNDMTCTTSEPGAWFLYFNSAGFIVYQVIFCLMYGGIALLSLFNIGISLRKGEILVFKNLVFSGVGLMAFCESSLSTFFLSFFLSSLSRSHSFPLFSFTLVKLLEVSIDYNNHLGRISVVSWGFLYDGSDILLFISSASWSTPGLESSRTRWSTTTLGDWGLLSSLAFTLSSQRL